MFPTSCHEIDVCKPRDGRDMRLCADNCVAGLLVGCCGWLVNEDGFVLKSVGDLLDAKGDLRVGS